MAKGRKCAAKRKIRGSAREKATRERGRMRSFAMPTTPRRRAPGTVAAKTTKRQNIMEFLNRMEITGIVGRAEVNAVGDTHVCNFSLVTEYNTKDKEGNPIIETTWFNVSAWEGKGTLPDLDKITRGSRVHAVGRVRMRKYTAQDGTERTSMDVIARKVELIPLAEEPMQPQRD